MFDLKAFEASAKESCPIYTFLGLEVLEVDDGVFRARIPLTRDTSNHINIMHAGVLFALGEMLGGMITARHLDKPEKFQPVVRNVTIDFKAPALTDVIAEAHFSADQVAEMNSKLEADGRYDFEQTAVLKDAAGTVVAETKASYALRNFMG